MSGLDINLFRQDKGGNPELLRQSCIKRNKNPQVVNTVITKDKQWRQLRHKLDLMKKEWNQLVKELGEKKKADKNDPCTELLAKKADNEARQEQIVGEEHMLKKQIDKLANTIGNFVHESVPVSFDEKDNRVERTWGKIPDLKITGKKGAYHHHEVLQAIDGYDPKRGQKIAGHRGYFLKGPGVMLNMALIQYGLHFLTKKGYTAMQPPYFMKREVMAETCQLSDFDEQLYGVREGKTEEDSYYMIATSEQPISGYFRGEWLEQKNLPYKYAGFSSCFRKEAGAHGKDNWGIFRIHQFEKIEQFVICKPEDSWAAHDEMIKVAEQFYQSLELPYQVICIVSGALNDAAAKKYDLEAWFPGYNAYRQLVSCSNCLDYQARNLDVRYGGSSKDGNQKFVHMLNGTLCATERTLCCILQNYQTEDGVRVPKVLQPYAGAQFFPYVKEPEHTEGAEKKDAKPVAEKPKKEKKEKKEGAEEKKQKKEGNEEKKHKETKTEEKQEKPATEVTVEVTTEAVAAGNDKQQVPAAELQPEPPKQN